MAKTCCSEGVLQSKSAGEATLEVKLLEKEIKVQCGHDDRRVLVSVASVC